MTAIDLGAREVQFAEMAPLAYDYLVLGLGAEVNFFGTEGAAEHAFPMYTLADAVRLKEHVLGALGGGRQGSGLIDDGALNVVVVGGGPTGVESAGRAGGALPRRLRQGLPDLPQDKARITLVEAGPELFSMFKPDLRAYTGKALEKRSVEVHDRRGRRVGRRPTRVTLKSGTVLEAHTLVWGAGLQGNRARPVARARARSEGTGSASGRSSPSRSIPRCTPSATSPAITDAKTEQVLPQLGSVALQSGEHAGEKIARRVAGKETKPFKYHDKGTMATIGRGAAVVQMLGGRTMKGKTAQARVGRRAPRAAADERGPREGGGRLGGGGVHAPAHRPDHRRNDEERSRAMTDATAEFFDGLRERGHEPLLEKATATMRFDLGTGRRTERWLVADRQGRHRRLAQERERPTASSEPTRRSSTASRAARSNAMAAMLRGAIGVEGELGGWSCCSSGCFPGPAGSRDQRAAAGYAGGRR